VGKKGRGVHWFVFVWVRHTCGRVCVCVCVWGGKSEEWLFSSACMFRVHATRTTTMFCSVAQCNDQRYFSISIAISQHHALVVLGAQVPMGTAGVAKEMRSGSVQ
jgi:hypothetical protein